MGEAYITRRGGGAPLNFKVVGGTSAPSNPTENTIWVNTNTEITGWHFGAEEPNVYKLQNEIRSDGSVDTRVCFAPHKLSEGEIVNFVIPYTVTYAFEWLTIIDAFSSYQRYCIRNMDKTLPAIWEKGTKVSVRISNDETALDVHKFRTAYIVGWGTYTAEEGMLWLQTGTTSPVAMNALKKNSIQVCPLNAKQYVGGAWVDKTAQSYQGGAWVDWWNGELFDNGDQFESITGGWVQANYAVYGGENTDAGTLTIGNTIAITANGGQCCKSARTKNKIDLTNYNTITVTGTCMYLLISTSTSGIPAALATENAKSLDISSFSGEYYVGVMARNYGSMSAETIKLS